MLRQGESPERIEGFLHFAGFRYWTASLLPMLVGTTLPFWQRPRGLSFRWLGALEFALAAVCVHAGFCFLLAYFDERPATRWQRSRLIAASSLVSALF
jgi:1,4-dihydroxy-2-naphthoate octaprenyltransferase